MTHDQNNMHGKTIFCLQPFHDIPQAIASALKNIVSIFATVDTKDTTHL